MSSLRSRGPAQEPPAGLPACFYKILLALSLGGGVLGSFGSVPAQAKAIDDGPQISSIGESLRNAGQRTLHILYVHGMGATGAGESQVFRKSLCGFLKGCDISKALHADRDFADSGIFAGGAAPPAFQYMQRQVWSSENWQASTPFVDHYVLRRSDGGPVVVDEINWWPLVFPLKCRVIMAGEARLAGPDAGLLDLCSGKPANKTDPHYGWISPQEAAALKSLPVRGALLNRYLKNNTLDWGISDALLAVGSMQDLFREAMRQLFVKSARFHEDGTKTDEWKQQQSKSPQGIDREFIVVSHSLGSYLVFATLNPGQQDSSSPGAVAQAKADRTDDAAARYILQRTSLVYFFANQVPVLELASMEDPSAAAPAQPAGAAQREAGGALSRQMMNWKTLRRKFGETTAANEPAARPPQVVAWSDPSDLLSWHVPEMDGLVIANLRVRNSWWHWLLADPLSAHDGYAGNKDVLRIMLGPSAAGVRQ